MPSPRAKNINREMFQPLNFFQPELNSYLGTPTSTRERSVESLYQNYKNQVLNGRVYDAHQALLDLAEFCSQFHIPADGLPIFSDEEIWDHCCNGFIAAYEKLTRFPGVQLKNGTWLGEMELTLNDVNDLSEAVSKSMDLILESPAAIEEWMKYQRAVGSTNPEVKRI